MKTPRNNIDEQNDFIKIVSIEDSEEYDRQNIHQHDYYEIIWFTKIEEEDTIQIDFGEYPVSDNCFYLISAGCLHRIDRAKKKGWVISLSKNFFYVICPVEIHTRSTFAINSIINQQKCDMCKQLIQMVLNEYDDQKRYNLLEAYFKALFIHLSPVFKKNQCCGHDKKLAADLLDLIEEYFIEHKEVGFYAPKLLISEKAANEMSKKVIGKTIKQLIHERLILEIKREIAADLLSFKEIANKLGFNEPSYFSRFFKNQTGFTPEEYKTHFNSNVER